jgi:2-polyprenyl-3-methyl-5-hydroxy-6-metoxy-1,4-benzoquinol methylase
MLTLVLLTLSLMRFAERGDAVLVWFVATSCGVLALTIGKPGANVNYFVEPIAALCMCGAVGLQRWQARRGWGAFVTTAVAFVVMWSVADLVPGYRAAYRSQAATIARSEAIALPPEALGGPVLVPASLTLLVEPRPEYYVNDSYTVGVVAAWGKLMTTDRIVDDLRHQRVGAVLVRPEEFRRREDGPNFIGDWQRGWNFWSIDEFREALLDAYAPVDRQYPLDVVLLLPKDSAGASARVPEPISLGLRGGWMDDDYGRSYRDLYRRHWWWRAREDLIVDILLHRLPAAARRRVLDVGCGDGVFFDRLEALGAEVRGIEPDESLVSKDGKHRSKIHVGAFDDAFETREPFSLVTMLDVLEHMADPSAALRRAREVVEPHGWWLFTVPAFPMLWTQHDVLNHHYARFTKRTLRALLRSAGLDAMRLEYFFHWLVPLKLAVRLKERVRAAAPAAPRVPATVINRTCYWISRGERATVGRPGVLPGSSLLAYGRFPA